MSLIFIDVFISNFDFFFVQTINLLMHYFKIFKENHIHFLLKNKNTNQGIYKYLKA